MKYKFTRVNTTLWVAIIKSFAPRRYLPASALVSKEKNRSKNNEPINQTNNETMEK